MLIMANNAAVHPPRVFKRSTQDIHFECHSEDMQATDPHQPNGCLPSQKKLAWLHHHRT